MQALDQIAAAAVQLAELAPKLEAVVTELETAVAELGGSATQMVRALAAVKRIADHTRILSINASIEAGRAGASGRAFGTVVEEIKTLADASAASTRDVEDRVDGIQGAVTRVSAAAVGPAGAADAGRQVRELTDVLLTAVGQYRFDAHVRAQRALEGILPSLVSASLDRIRTEMALERWLKANPWFELAYATTSTGRQFVVNLRSRDGNVTHDPSALEQNWSDRPWFQEATAKRETSVTDLYRSAATGEFCFTVASAWRNPGGDVIGVVGADVSFSRIVLTRNVRDATVAANANG